MCGLFPEEAAAWTTLAGVLYEQGQYRDALAPARTALEKGQDGPGRVLLARILNAVGPEGREESRALAVAGIEGHPDREVLGASDLAQLARIAHDGGADLSLCRRADDHVWSRRDTEALPDESIGAAVARRCDGVWAEDAPGWLARLAEAADEQPLEIARFIVERGGFARVLPRAGSPGALPPRSQRGAGRRAPPRLARARAPLRVRRQVRSRPCGGPGCGLARVRRGPSPERWSSLPSTGSPMSAPSRPRSGSTERCGFVRAELAQGAFFDAGGVGVRETVLLISALDDELIGWVEWAAWRGALQDVAEGRGGGRRTGTRDRMANLFALVNRGGDEIRAATWPTRWHETERR